MAKIIVNISVDPADLECGSDGDLINETSLLAASRDAVEHQWPEEENTVVFRCLQVGHNQGDGWCRVTVDGKRSNWQWSHFVDCTDESLYE